MRWNIITNINAIFIVQLADGSHVMVSAEVKNAGRDVEVNAINMVFGRSAISDLHEKLVYVGNELTPEQQALLDGTTPHQYPDARGHFVMQTRGKKLHFDFECTGEA